MCGKPVIRGTRITVEHILTRLSEGWTEQDLIKSYPQLTPEDIREALAYASAAIAGEEIVFSGIGHG